MLHKTMSYMDYNGTQATDELWFNLTKAELAKLQVKMDGKYIDYLKQLVENKKIEGLFDFIYNLVLDSYGRRSEDGKKFYKTKAERDEFEASIAFSELLAQLINDPEMLKLFTKSILPHDFQDISLDEVTIADHVTALPSGV